MAASNVNPLISSQKSSELQAILHPLVLLTISDYITRHTLRSQPGPIVGALLGQQNGREITIEHAFDCHTKQAPEVEGGYLLDSQRFAARLEQMKTVHKDRSLDLVGWYTLLATDGPTPTILPIHHQLLSEFNESALLLGFHPEEVLSHTVGGKLPMSIYESNYEVDDPRAAETDGEDKKMDDGESKLKLRFRELPYTVETGEAEMISMDHVARGAGNATAIEAPKETSAKPKVQLVEAGGKRRVVVAEESGEDSLAEVQLLPEEEEMVAALTAKANAVKMLQGRIRLITTYLERLPSEYLAGLEQSPAASASRAQTTPSHTILRQIQALVNRLDLVVPSDVDAFEKEVLCEENDVAITSRLNDLMQSISGMRDLGKKFGIAEAARSRNRGAAPADFTGYGPSSFNIPGAGDIMM